MHKKSVYIVKNKQTRDNHITGQLPARCLPHRDWLLALCTSEIKSLGLHPSACTFTEQVPAFLTGFPLHKHQLYWIDVSETVGVCTYTNDK